VIQLAGAPDTHAPSAASPADGVAPVSSTRSLVALTAHARHVPSEAREAFADAAEAAAADPRAILLRTCHRVELYVVDEPAPGLAPLDLPELPDGARRFEGPEAARHVFTVAAGLDSVVVGEDQILHQLRECLAGRHLPGAVGCPVTVGSPDRGAMGLHPVLERLFQIALHLGRETRSWREGPPRSLADVALDRIVPATGPLLGRRVLVVGAGRMARLSALAASRQGARVLVANRSTDRAAALAYDANGEPAAFGPDAPLPDADAVILAIAAVWPLSADARRNLLAGTQTVIDLSSPPALDAATRAALGARYTSVDDLAQSPHDELRSRLRKRFERALADAEAAFEGWVRTRASVPAIQALTDLAEERRAEEIERLFRRLDLPAEERELVEQMSRRLVAGLLHAPLVQLRDDGTGDLERVARSLFSL
jgi:glutamyl-tRNA reductase